MATTTKRGYPYPRPVGDGADASYWLQRLAETIETDVDGLLELTKYSALPALAGWIVSGSFDCLTIGKRTQVNYLVELKRGNSVLNYVSSASLVALGTVIPPEARGVGNGIYAPIMLSGSGASGILQGYVNPVSGEILFRHTANISISQNQTLYFNGVYYIDKTE